MIYLDTHTVVWLYGGEIDRIPQRARDLINEHDVLISPMVLVEVQYLIEIGRFTDSVDELHDALERDIGLVVCDLPFPRVARRALAQSWTRDPFDRIIVSQAALREAPLVTKDQAIHEHYPHAVWAHR